VLHTHIYTYIPFSVHATYINVEYAEYFTRELYIKHDPHEKRHTQETKRHTCKCTYLCMYMNIYFKLLCIGKRDEHICILRANVIVFRYVQSQKRQVHLCDKRLPNMNAYTRKNQMQKRRIHMYPTSIHDHVELHTFPKEANTYA